jgi:glutathione-independent formaldehyde dehydrogenase
MPSFIVSYEIALDDAPDAYDHFDRRLEGWTKVVLKLGSEAEHAHAHGHRRKK